MKPAEKDALDTLLAHPGFVKIERLPRLGYELAVLKGEGL